MRFALATVVLILPAAMAATGPVRGATPLPDIASCTSLANRPSGDVPPASRAICAHPEAMATHDALARAARIIAERGTPQDSVTFAQGEPAYQAKLAACMADDDRARDACLVGAQSSRLSAAETITDGLPSFSCAKPDTAIERAICADSELAKADREIAEKYADLPKLMSHEAVVALRHDQRAWLAERNRCESEADGTDLHKCLLRSERQRLVALDAIAGEQTLAFDAAVAEVATDPKAAAVAMRRFAEAGRPLADAWLVYLARYAPESGVAEDDAARSLDKAIAALLELEPRDHIFVASIRQPEAAAKPGDPKGVLLLLRLLLDVAPGVDPRSDEKPYCFIFMRNAAAYPAFGSLWGSSLDSPSAQCKPTRGLFEQAAWYRLEAGFQGPLDAANGEAGTIRYGVYTDWGVEALKATDMPQAFLDAPDTLEASRRTIRDWDGDIAWSKSDRDTALASIEPAIRATSAWLAEHRRLPADQADRAAERIVAGWIGSRLVFIQDQDPR